MKEEDSRLEDLNFSFEELLNNSSIVFYQCELDDNFPILFISENATSVLGYDPKEFYRTSTFWLNNIHPDDRKRVQTLFLDILNTENRTFEYRFQKKDGSYIWLRDENTVAYDEEENPVAITGMAVNISERKQAEEHVKKLNVTLEERIKERTRDLTDTNRKLKKQIQHRKKVERSLEESEYRYRAYSELSFDAIFEITLDGIITDCNVRACKMFGYSRNELIGMNTLKLTPEQFKDSQPEIISEEVTTGPEAWERKYQKKDGTIFDTEINTKIYTRGGEDRLIAYVRDISEQKKYERKIRKSLEEKEILLAEIHHRVKNNLAIICGLLEMQTFNAENERISTALKKSQSRIQSIAMVHEKLYQSESFSDIAIDSYIEELLLYLKETYSGNFGHVTVKQEVKPISFDVNRAIPVGLILSELITNAHKHAFDRIRNGILKILLQKSGDTVTLEVHDNGVGLPGDFKIDQCSSLGMTLIQTLVKQLNGTLNINSENGTSFRIVFPVS